MSHTFTKTEKIDIFGVEIKKSLVLDFDSDDHYLIIKSAKVFINDSLVAEPNTISHHQYFIIKYHDQMKALTED